MANQNLDAGDLVGCIEEWCERLDSAWHATTIPMPAEIHAQALAEIVERMRDEMKVVIEQSGLGSS